MQIASIIILLVLFCGLTAAVLFMMFKYKQLDRYLKDVKKRICDKIDDMCGEIDHLTSVCDSFGREFTRIENDVSELASHIGKLQHDHDETVLAYCELEQRVIAFEQENADLKQTAEKSEKAIGKLEESAEVFKAFYDEHGKNFLEAEEEELKQQKAITDGINSIVNYGTKYSK
jgi:chromosome segregation ATPase